MIDAAPALRFLLTKGTVESAADAVNKSLLLAAVARHCTSLFTVGDSSAAEQEAVE